MQTEPDSFRRRFAGSVDWAIARLMAGDIEGAAAQMKLARSMIHDRYGQDSYEVLEIEALHAVCAAALDQKNAAEKRAETASDRNPCQYFDR